MIVARRTHADDHRQPSHHLRPGLGFDLELSWWVPGSPRCPRREPRSSGCHGVYSGRAAAVCPTNSVLRVILYATQNGCRAYQLQAYRCTIRQYLYGMAPTETVKLAVLYVSPERTSFPYDSVGVYGVSGPFVLTGDQARGKDQPKYAYTNVRCGQNIMS